MKDGTKAIKQTKVINSDGTFWVKEEQIIQRYNERGFLYRNRSLYLKDFKDRYLPDQLSWTDKGKLERLYYEMGENQILVYDSHNEKKYHTTTTIAKIFNQTEKQTRKLISNAVEADVMRVVRINGKKCYMLSPIYKLYGKRISLITFVAFQEQLMRELPAWAINTFLNDSRQMTDYVEIVK